VSEEQREAMPVCVRCGMTEITWAHAAARGWRCVLRQLHCPLHAGAFPAWTRQTF
jgi:hypothetical protein